VKVEKWAKNGQMVQNCYPLSPGIEVRHLIATRLPTVDGKDQVQKKVLTLAALLTKQLLDNKWEEGESEQASHATPGQMPRAFACVGEHRCLAAAAERACRVPDVCFGCTLHFNQDRGRARAA
jgi:hypothetical protein